MWVQQCEVLSSVLLRSGLVGGGRAAGMTFSLLFCFISYLTFNPVLTTGFLSLSQPRFSSWVYRKRLPCDRIHFYGSWLSWLKSSLQLYILPQDPSESVRDPWERKFLPTSKGCAGIIFLGGRKDFCSHLYFLYPERLPVQGENIGTQGGYFFSQKVKAGCIIWKERLLWVVSKPGDKKWWQEGSEGVHVPWGDV